MSFSVSLKLKKQINVEFERLNNLIETYRPLLSKCAKFPPDKIEMGSLASMLHSFYTGIENIFKRVTLEIDQASLGGDAWHRELLNAMIRPNSNRESLISNDMHKKLEKYLDFRHVFRHAYAFELQWKKMSWQVKECEQTLRQLQEEISSFLKKLPE